MFQSTFESACAEVSATLFHGLFASVGNGRGFDDVMAKIILGVFVVPMLIPIWAPLVLLDWFGRASVGTFRIAGAPALLVYAALRRVERDDPEMKHRVMFWARVGALGVASTLALVVAAENADVARANRSDEREDDDEREEGSDGARGAPREGKAPSSRRNAPQHISRRQHRVVRAIPRRPVASPHSPLTHGLLERPPGSPRRRIYRRSARLFLYGRCRR